MRGHPHQGGAPHSHLRVKAMSTNHHDVLRFHQKLGLPVADRPTVIPEKDMRDRLSFIREELDELILSTDYLYSLGTGASNTETCNALGEIFDALLDLVYVAMGTALQLGLPWQQGWDMVQDANMQKERGPGSDPHKLGVIKPKGWTPPDHGEFLREYIKMIKHAESLPSAFPTGIRCVHGLHEVADTCPDCENERITGTKPSSRGKR